MSAQAFIPFDPDSIGGGVIVHAAPTGETMLSEVIAQEDWHMPEAEDGETGRPGDAERGTARPLDNVAKWRLSALAERAYGLLKSRGMLAGETLEGYRGRIAVAACGKRIRHACLGDRMKIQGAFLREMERAEEASRCAVKAQATAKDIALFKLKELCERRQFPATYAAGIAWRVFKLTLEQCSAKQVWKVFFTITNNANKRDGKGCEDNRWKKLKRQRSQKEGRP